MMYFIYLTTFKEEYNFAINARLVTSEWTNGYDFKYAILVHNGFGAN